MPFLPLQNKVSLAFTIIVHFMYSSTIFATSLFLFFFFHRTSCSNIPSFEAMCCSC
jgi:hypothetical protein